jgi:hypothetical protein
LGDEIPVDGLERVQSAGEVFVELQRAFDLLGFEADVGVDEEEMSGGGIVQEGGEQAAAGAGDEGVVAHHRDTDIEPGRFRVAHETYY